MLEATSFWPMGTALLSDWKEGTEEAGGWQPPRCARTCPVAAARSVSRPGRAVEVPRRLVATVGSARAFLQAQGPAPLGPSLTAPPQTQHWSGPRAQAPPRAGLTWPYCGLGAWASDPSATTTGGSTTTGRGSPGWVPASLSHSPSWRGARALLARWPVCGNTLTRPLGKWCNEQVALNKGNKTPNRTHEGFSAHLFQEQIRTREVMVCGSTDRNVTAIFLARMWGNTPGKWQRLWDVPVSTRRMNQQPAVLRGWEPGAATEDGGRAPLA